jgi:hypothetical protein
MKTEKRDYRYGVIKKPEFARERTSRVLEREDTGRTHCVRSPTGCN